MTELELELENRREAYRVRFPRGYELDVFVGGKYYKVIDVSETGMCIEGDNLLIRDGVCKGCLHWSEDSTSSFTGRLHRQEKGQTMLRNVDGIPLARIMEQQRRLIRVGFSVSQLKVFTPD